MDLQLLIQVQPSIKKSGMYIMQMENTIFFSIFQFNYKINFNCILFCDKLTNRLNYLYFLIKNEEREEKEKKRQNENVTFI